MVSNFILPNTDLNSGYKTLLDLVMIKTKRNIMTLLNKAKLCLYFYDENNNKREIKILLKEKLFYNIKNLKIEVDGIMDSQDNGNFIIEIEKINNVDNILSILAHETTHLSQTLNGMIEFYENSGLRNTEYNNFYENSIIEIDANMGAILWNIKNINYVQATEILFASKCNFKILYNFKKFIKSALNFEIKKENILDFRKYVLNNSASIISELYNPYIICPEVEIFENIPNEITDIIENVERIIGCTLNPVYDWIEDMKRICV